MSDVTPIRPNMAAPEIGIAFGLPGGKEDRRPYVDEDRDYLEHIFSCTIQAVINMIDVGTTVDAGTAHRASDILRLARIAMEGERMRFTTYTGEAVAGDDDPAPEVES